MEELPKDAKIKHDFLRLILSKSGLKIVKKIAKYAKIKHSFLQLSSLKPGVHSHYK